jgi:hypothetical protein
MLRALFWRRIERGHLAGRIGSQNVGDLAGLSEVVRKRVTRAGEIMERAHRWMRGGLTFQVRLDGLAVSVPDQP